MLRKLRLVNYRSFQDFTIAFPDTACLVGPNNAGKSTVLTALRLVDGLLRVAHSRKAARGTQVGRGRNAYRISLGDFPSLRESLRHEFRNSEARLELTWKNGNRLIAIWPESDGYDDEIYGYFYLELKGGAQPTSIAVAKSEFPRLGVVPILSPLDHAEPVLTETYVRGRVTSRLSSRHFRNHLRLLENSGDLDEFREFAAPWLPGMKIVSLGSHEAEDGRELDLYLSEPGSRVDKEITWAGDGIQIWLQILFHVYRLRGSGVIVLDEPDVYLHADLQRRLVHLLESMSCQTIVATHSAEIVAELPKASIVWVDRSRRHAGAIRDEGLLEKLSNTLGSQFNLKLARAMRSRVLLMVEGKDMRVIRRLSRTIGAERLENEDGITVIQLQGYSGSDHIASFRWIVNEFLEGAVECFVLLDRDYRSDLLIEKTESLFAAAGVNSHIWRRKELESYLLDGNAISRLSGASIELVDSVLGEIVDEMENEVFSRMLDERARERVGAKLHMVSLTSEFKSEFDSMWANPSWRLCVAPPKQIIGQLNRRLSDNGFRPISAERLALELRDHEIPNEMRRFLEKVDRAAMS